MGVLGMDGEWGMGGWKMKHGRGEEGEGAYRVLYLHLYISLVGRCDDG